MSIRLMDRVLHRGLLPSNIKYKVKLPFIPPSPSKDSAPESPHLAPVKTTKTAPQQNSGLPKPMPRLISRIYALPGEDFDGDAQEWYTKTEKGIREGYFVTWMCWSS